MNSASDGPALLNHHYNMVHQKRGKAVIINNRNFSSNIGLKPRDFSDRDTANLYVHLNNLGFDIEMHENLKGDNIERMLYKVSREDHTNVDCLLTIILSYGDQGLVYGTDRPVHTENVLTWFKGSICPSLAGKPKLFIFQVCDPSLYSCQSLAEADDGRTTSKHSRHKRAQKIPSEADFLLVWSTIPGAVPWRDSHKEGSSFVDAICAEMNLIKQGNHLEVTRMLTKVIRRVAYDLEKNAPLEFKNSGYKLPVIINMLTKELYLNPPARQILSNRPDEGYTV